MKTTGTESEKPKIIYINLKTLEKTRRLFESLPTKGTKEARRRLLIESLRRIDARNEKTND